MKNNCLQILKVSALFFVLITTRLHAQSLPVNYYDLDDVYRREQLIGKVDSTLSFTVKPLFNSILTDNSNLVDPDSTLKKDKFNSFNGTLYQRNKSLIKILPFSWLQQYNSKLPY